MDLAFSKKLSDKRKEWLSSYNRDEVLDYKTEEVTHKDFINKDITSNLLNFDEQRLKLIIQRHFKYSKSLKAKEILDNWGFYIRKFIKVVPMDLKRLSLTWNLNNLKKNLKEKLLGNKLWAKTQDS